MALDLSAVETRLWAAADQLWANTGLRPADFSEPVLGLIFLRYADKRFEEARRALLKKGFDEDELEPHDFQAEGVVYLPDHARFSYLLQLTEGDNVGKALNEAMLLIEGGNSELKGVMPRSYNRLPNATLSRDAVGIVVCLLTFSDLSHVHAPEIFAEHFRRLRDFALDHGEVGVILRAID